MNRGNTVKQYGFVVRELVSREIKRKYARSYLGILWSVLNPLLMMIVMSAIFSTMFRRSIENYPIYYLTGNIIFQLFSTATNTTMTCLVDNKQMLIKVKFPMQIFPLSRSVTALVNFGYSCIAYAAILIFFRIPLSVTMLFFPVIVAAAFLFALGVSYILAVAYVFFGDIKHLYSVFLTLLMYCSAIFYPVESITGWMQNFITMNPVYNYIACAREVMMYQQMPEGGQLAAMVIWALGMYLIGSWIFKVSKNAVMQKV